MVKPFVIDIQLTVCAYYTDMKATLKGVAIALSILAMVVVVLSAVDMANDVSVAVTDTYVKVTVVDLNDSPVHNAKVEINGQTFLTDNKGVSPSIQLDKLTNCYDANITDWGTVTIVITGENLTPTCVFNCVVYAKQTRKLTVKVYPLDDSNLPYVSYVESPPSDYIENLLKSQNKGK